jgi:hypothetical protein
MAAPYLLTSSTVVQAPVEVAFDGVMNAPLEEPAAGLAVDPE